MNIDGDLIDIIFVVVILYFILLSEYFVKTHNTSNPVNSNKSYRRQEKKSVAAVFSYSSSMTRTMMKGSYSNSSKNCSIVMHKNINIHTKLFHFLIHYCNLILVTYNLT